MCSRRVRQTVYPIEELKCLDKVWHKQCFKCTVCGMTLNMKNYKGYDKKPYCEPHYPKTVASVVADTPEMRRLAENTKNQSNIKYHAEYEKMKGTKIDLANDPEMERLKKNTQVQSNVAYLGMLEKKDREEMVRPKDAPEGQNPADGPQLINAVSPMSYHSQSPIPPKSTTPNNLIYSSDHGGAGMFLEIFIFPLSRNRKENVGSIADYDPMNGNWGTVTQTRPSEKLGYLKSQVEKGPPRFCADFADSSQQQQPPSSITSSISPHSTLSSPQSNYGAGNGGNQMMSPTGKAGFAVKAIYDYTAADKDEISFLEGDVIVNCEKIDDGWMTGTVQRSLQWGMLPANYVQPHKLPTGLHRLS